MPSPRRPERRGTGDPLAAALLRPQGRIAAACGVAPTFRREPVSSPRRHRKGARPTCTLPYPPCSDRCCSPPSWGSSLAAWSAGTAAADNPAAAAGGGASASSEAVLKRGDRGDAVRSLQRALGVSADGVFGKQTERAVKRFQRSKGLTVDGVVGPQTRAALGLRPFSSRAVDQRQRASSCRASCAGSPSASPAATRRPSRPAGSTAASTSSAAAPGARWAATAIRPRPPRPSRTGARSSSTASRAPRPGLAAARSAAGRRAPRGATDAREA